MNDVKKLLENWLEELSNFKFPNYEHFPDLDLYMDQVVTYLERNLQVLSTSSLDKVVTSSMINNYVKGEVITAPIQKKYNREHLALIEETCSLKQVLSIAEIKQILDVQYKDTDKASAFNHFKELSSKEFDKAVLECQDELLNIKGKNDTNSLTDLALALAVSANAKITIAKRILYYLMRLENMQKENSEKQEKEKKEAAEQLKKEEKQRKEEEERLRKEEEKKHKEDKVNQLKLAKN